VHDPRAPIGIFDSGIGGLTVAREIARALPHEDLRYLGDTARLPYGSKSPETVRRYAERCVTFLVDQGVKAVVIACNTASALALEPLRRRFAPLPILGVIEPGARAAVQATRTRRIGVIGQEGTVRSRSYELAILSREPTARVFSAACPLLVPLAEEGWVDTDVSRLVIRRYCGDFVDTNVDTLVLGCTHYPLFRHILAEEAPRVLGHELTLVDSATTVTAELIELLDEQGLVNPQRGEGSRRFFMTDLPERFTTMAERFFGAPFDGLELVDL